MKTEVEPTLKGIVEFLDGLDVVLRSTYPGAFPRTVREGCIMMPNRYAWEVQITAGTAALEKAASHLRKAMHEADPVELHSRERTESQPTKD